MKLLVDLLTSSLYGEELLKNIEEKFDCKSEHWMLSEYDDCVKDFWKKSSSTLNDKMVDDTGLVEEFKKMNTIPCLFTQELSYHQTVKE